jgi:hypothetical protein
VPVSTPVHPFGWYTLDDMAGLKMFDDTRLLAEKLMPVIATLQRGPAVAGAAAGMSAMA